MKSIYTHQSENIMKTWFFMGTFLVLFIVFGYLLSGYFGNSMILYIMVAFSSGMAIWSYWHSDKAVLKMQGARPITKEDAPELYNIVENLAITAGLPMPKLYIMEEEQMNAFATGRDPEHAAMAFTRGLLNKLDRAELEGVAAHEMSHIGNHDMLVMTIAVILAGFISIAADWMRSMMFFGGGSNERPHPAMVIGGVLATVLAPVAAMLIQMVISRKREFLADATGALLTRYPEGLASALEKISTDSTPLHKTHGATAHLFIANPFKGRAIKTLFATHPPVEERIRRLREMDFDGKDAV